MPISKYAYVIVVLYCPQVFAPVFWGFRVGDDDTTCVVCAWAMLADSDMSPVYTLPLVLCALVMC